MAFDPDAYLAKPDTTGFNPDAYLNGNSDTTGASQNILQEAVGTGKRLLGVGLNSIGGLLNGAAGLAVAGAGKLGVISPQTAQNARAEIQQNTAQNTARTNADLGTPGPIESLVGGAIPYLAVPEAKLPDAFSSLPPMYRALMNITKGGTENAGLGAASQEGAGNSPNTGAEAGLALGVGTQTLKAIAPSWLKFIASPNKAQQSSLNPLTTAGTQEALEQGTIPYFSLAAGASNKVGDLLQKQNATRAGLMDRTGAYINIPNVVNRARQSLQDDIGSNMKSGISLADATAAEKWFQDFQESAKLNPNYNPSNGQLPISDAMQLKTSTGQNTNFSADDVPNAGRGLANRQLYGQLKDRIETRMGNTPQADQFSDVNAAMRNLSPLQEALQNKGYAHGMSPWEVAADLGGTGFGLEGHPLGFLAPAYSLGRRAPGTATAMFNSPSIVPPILGSGAAENTLTRIANPDSSQPSPSIPSYLLPFTAGR